MKIPNPDPDLVSNLHSERTVKSRPACTRGEGGSSIVKVPGDVPPGRVYLFKLSSPAKGILFANFSPFSLGKGMLFGNLGKRNVRLGNSCKETQIFSNFGQGNAKIWQVLSRKSQIMALLM